MAQRMAFFSRVVRRPILFAMIFLAIAFAGVLGFLQLKVDLLPTVNLPIVSVVVPCPGMGTEDVEELVTKKLESVFSDLGGLKSLKTVSREGVAELLVEFQYGKRNISEAAIETQRRINEVRNQLPTTIEEPVVRTLDPASRPIATLTLSSERMDMRELRELAENRLRRRYERIPGVARVMLNGGYIRQINVLADKNKLDSYRVALRMIYETLRSRNANVPAGDLKYPGASQEVLSRTMGQFNTVDDIRGTVLTHIEGVPIRVSDVARVEDGHKEPMGLASVNGRPAVSIDIKKQTGTNTVEIADALRKLTDEIRRELPEGVTLQIARDDSEFIRDAIRGISDSAWQGFLLAFLSVLLLLGVVRPSVVIFIAVPTSIVSAFALMWAAGLSLNMVTLYALTITIGVNFDATVVVMENILRYMQEGKPRLQAAGEATQELVVPLLASLMTNLIVFVPLTQLKGYIGELMRAMAITAIFAQIMGTLVGIFWTANLTPRIVTTPPTDVTPVPVLRQIARVTVGLLHWVTALYARTLEACLRHRGATVVATALLFLASFALAPFIGIEFMPRTDQNAYFVDVEGPVGTTLEHMRGLIDNIERVIGRHPEIQTVVSNIGGDDPTSPPVYKASVSLNLVSRRKRAMTAVDSGDPRTDIITRLRQEIREEVPGVRHIQFVQPAPWWGSAGAPIEIKLSGFDWQLLNETADQYVAALEGVPGLFDVQKNTRPGKIEWRLKVKEDKLGQMGMGIGELAQFLRVAVHGGDISLYRTEFRTHALFRDRDIYVVTRLEEDQRRDIEDLLNLRIPTAEGFSVPLATVADAYRARSENFISKEDKARQVVVSIQTSDEPLNDLVLGRLVPKLRQLGVPLAAAFGRVTLPNGLDVEVTGEVTRMNDQVVGMTLGFLIAFAFVYMILAGQFESFLQPFIMMMAAPVMMIGVFLALWMTGQTLNTTSGNGIFALLGVVVNASVILIDYINTLRSRGMEREAALKQAGRTRLRPILLTVSTTFIAMAPMALSRAEGSDVYKPLAIAFMGGLFTSTVLTLVLIPVLYSLFDDLARRLRGEKMADPVAPPEA